MFIKYILLLTLIPFSVVADTGNTTNQSFNKAKRMLERDVYTADSERVTLYCNAKFDTQKNIFAPEGFETRKYVKRAKRLEWEHVVPAENFGRTFPEWREGHERCENSKKETYKGRRCAEKVNDEYKLMQADMYNLYPAIGAVNASRSNYNFTLLADQKSSFGSCEMKVSNRKVEPPESSRGMIARTYLYMDHTYSRFSISKQQRQLMDAWSKQYPVSGWECERGRRIAELQVNINQVLINSCEKAGL
ncbi:MAG: endonuclease [Psychromonas sp.]